MTPLLTTTFCSSRFGFPQTKGAILRTNVTGALEESTLEALRTKSERADHAAPEGAVGAECISTKRFEPSYR